MHMNKYAMQIITPNCTGCRRCQLACSQLYTGAFNPVNAHLSVEILGKACSVRFTDDCRECGVCADNCFYDALQKRAKENEK